MSMKINLNNILIFLYVVVGLMIISKLLDSVPGVFILWSDELLLVLSFTLILTVIFRGLFGLPNLSIQLQNGFAEGVIERHPVNSKEDVLKHLVIFGILGSALLSFNKVNSISYSAKDILNNASVVASSIRKMSIHAFVEHVENQTKGFENGDSQRLVYVETWVYHRIVSKIQQQYNYNEFPELSNLRNELNTLKMDAFVFDRMNDTSVTDLQNKSLTRSKLNSPKLIKIITKNSDSKKNKRK